MTERFHDAIKLIKDASRIAIAGHMEPDPDCIGSVTAFGLGLRTYGKEVRFFNDHEIPGNVHCVPDEVVFEHVTPDDWKPDLFIGLDSSDPARLGSVSKPFLNGQIPALIIDHHKTNTGFGTVNVTRAHAASTAEIIPDFLKALGVVISAEIANCVLTGMVADTLNFTTESVAANTLRIASDMIEAGGDLNRVSYLTMKARKYESMLLWGVGLNNLQKDGDVVWSTITQEERKVKGIDLDLNHNLASQLRNIIECGIVAVFSERESGEIAISMRAKPDYDVSDIAYELGGGGHKAAAGTTLDMTMDEALAKVLPMLKAALGE